jgi:[protein-PII] uridylyltransferase
MAKRTFLNEDEWQEATRLCLPPEWEKKSGDEIVVRGNSETLSTWLERKLLSRFELIPEWTESEPIALGSWARGELCPSSDIDLIFCGPDKVVLKVVDEIQSEGFRLRYRVPQDENDWSVGVEPFDVLAILNAKAFEKKGAEKLVRQQKLIHLRDRKFKAGLMSAMRRERKERSKRYDSISNFLEPNLKYGPGGLRDLQQALTVVDLFPQKFNSQDSALELLKNYKQLFLAIRHRLHLMSGHDVLSGQDQLDLAQWLGFSEGREFMQTLQTGLRQVSFYADWVVAVATVSQSRKRLVEQPKIDSLKKAFRCLQDDSTVLMQARVRHFALERPQESLKDVGVALTTYFRLTEKLVYLDALMTSQLLASCIPDLKRVSGLSQHDHYHRYTVDEHIRQAIKKLKSLATQNRRLGRLREFVKDWTDFDWSVLLWTCLYHDLAKGKGGDHSTEGADLVEKQFRALGLSAKLAEEVAWMVRNHLILSTAAFRLNPKSPTTWKRLGELGVKDERLLRLAVFTAIDIQATNPEAWGDWKEKLLYGLVKTLHAPEAINFMDLLALAQKRRVQISGEFVKEMDSLILEAIPGRILLEEYQSLRKAKNDLPLRVLRNKKGEVWIRFHKKNDEPGLFYRYVQWIFASGCRVQQSSVRTLPDFGVYDWFHVKTSRTPQSLQKLLLSLVGQGEPASVMAKFESIEILSEDDGGVVLSFKGRDKKGLLVSAARSLHLLGAEIIWAKVHTWGRQIEDIFCVRCTHQSADSLLRDLQAQLLEQDIDPQAKPL